MIGDRKGSHVSKVLEVIAAEGVHVTRCPNLLRTHTGLSAAQVHISLHLLRQYGVIEAVTTEEGDLVVDPKTRATVHRAGPSFAEAIGPLREAMEA